MTKFTNFLDDAEKMHDFFILSKEEFLKSYSYLNEKEWKLTNVMVKKKVHEIKYYMRDVLPISQLLDLREFLNDVIEEEKNVC